MNCPQCGKPDLRKFVEIIIACPAEQRAFNKSALRSKHINVLSTEDVDYYCYECGWSTGKHPTLKSSKRA